MNHLWLLAMVFYMHSAEACTGALSCISMCRDKLTPPPQPLGASLLADDNRQFLDPLTERCGGGGKGVHTESALLVCAFPVGSRYQSRPWYLWGKMLPSAEFRDLKLSHGNVWAVSRDFVKEAQQYPREALAQESGGSAISEGQSGTPA